MSIKTMEGQIKKSIIMDMTEVSTIVIINELNNINRFLIK